MNKDDARTITNSLVEDIMREVHPRMLSRGRFMAAVGRLGVGTALAGPIILEPAERISAHTREDLSSRATASRAAGPQMITHFRDKITFDDTFANQLGAQPGDTVVVGARLLTVTTRNPNLLPGCNLTLVADQLAAIRGAGLSTTSGSYTIYAQQIMTPLALITKGVDGVNGQNAVADTTETDWDTRGKPHLVRVPGKPATAGTPGGPGGAITIRFASAKDKPTARSLGGRGGTGGNGAPANPDVPRAKSYPNGHNGADGASGPISITRVSRTTLLTQIAAQPWAQEWAGYRVEVGTYFFRQYTPFSQIALAITEFTTALALDPRNTTATQMLTRIVNEQTPLGWPRHLDIAPDVTDLAANLATSVQFLQGAFTLAGEVVGNTQVAQAMRGQMEQMVTQLQSRQQEAAANIQIAQDGVDIASAQVQVTQGQIQKVQAQIVALQNQSFSVLDIVTTVGELAGAIASIAGGVVSVVGVPGAIVAFGSLAQNATTLLNLLKSAGNDLESLAKGIDGIYKASQGVVSFSKAVSQLEDASNASSGQGTSGQLLAQLASLVAQRLIDDLKGKQAQDQLAGATQAQQDAANDLALAQEQLANWSQQADFLNNAATFMIAAARRLADMVMLDAFYVARALEIYELEGPLPLQFNYGYVSPDEEHDLPIVERASASLQSLSALPIAAESWSQIYSTLNLVQAGGFDVVQPNYQITIDDPAALASLQTAGGLKFTVNVADLPPEFYEVKVAGVQVELVGANAAQSVIFWVQHSGHWMMRKRGSGEIGEFFLNPHNATCNLAPAGAGLKGTIPQTPSSPTTAGPPFSFWGRGIAADWYVFPTDSIPPAAHLDLSHLSQVVVTFQGLAYAKQSIGPRPIIVHATARPVPSPSVAILRRIPVRKIKRLPPPPKPRR